MLRMSNIIKRGALIVLEGCDKAGKTTQARLIAEDCRNEGIPSQFMCFPDRSTHIGKLIDSYLKCNNNVEDHAIHLLFSANRWEAVPRMLELLQQGVTLIVDRYAYSGVAFSAAKKNFSIDWCKQCDIGLPKPDLVLFFDLPLEEAIRRSSFGGERYEQNNFQLKVRRNFIALQDETFRVVHANRPVDVIRNEVKAFAFNCIRESQQSPLQNLWVKPEYVTSNNTDIQRTSSIPNACGSISVTTTCYASGGGNDSISGYNNCSDSTSGYSSINGYTSVNDSTNCYSSSGYVSPSIENGYCSNIVGYKR